MRIPTIRPALLCLIFAVAFTTRGAEAAPATPPLRVLLITGGCCHDYFYQADALIKGSKRTAKIDWTVIHEGNSSTDQKARLYDNPKWYDGFDVVIHNECFANVKDTEWIKKITQAHAEHHIPAAVIHCAMHTYRGIDDDCWRQFLGVTSRRHEHRGEKLVTREISDHPIMKNFPETWTCKDDELYVIEKVWPDTTVLATGASDEEKTKGTKHAAFWINEFGKNRVFGTTFGHSTATFDDPVFIDTVTRGILWAADRLDK